MFLFTRTSNEFAKYIIYQVGIGKDDFRVEQLEADAVNLNSNFVYILISITVDNMTLHDLT